jgi:hypothetical protein
MAITLDISADLESRLRQEAAKQGMDPIQYIVQAVRSRLQQQNSAVHCLDAEQSRLLEEINRGLSQDEWNRYYALVAKRQTGVLSGDEFAELMAASHRIEELSARRMECLAELSRLRGTSLSELLDQLGIEPPPVI